MLLLNSNNLTLNISINSVSNKSLSIHEKDNILRFSSCNVCNMKLEEDNYTFISVGKNLIKDKIKIHKNVVVLHILRNVSDNDSLFTL